MQLDISIYYGFLVEGFSIAKLHTEPSKTLYTLTNL